ncbi:MAG: hypothetical protein D5S00_11350 [Tindallia sp. MSAO_Bac2]|nr:MAG: hypothetical protein D5S00_11350 [Tindallia sp. MSAO_Bac2]
MLCQQCKQRKATVHLKENIQGQTNERFICDICAEKMNHLNSPFSFSVHNLLSSYFDQEPKAEKDGAAIGEKACPQCGQLYRHYKETGLLGCAKCYETFRPMIMPLIRRIQGSNQHVGKVPAKTERIQRFQRRVQHLRSALKDAIRKEEYEKAAELRDQISQLENKVVHMKEESK